jgi:hypothetical protein
MGLEVTMLEDVPSPGHDEDAEDTLRDLQDAVLSRWRHNSRVVMWSRPVGEDAQSTTRKPQDNCHLPGVSRCGRYWDRTSDLCRMNAKPIPPVANGYHRTSSISWALTTGCRMILVWIHASRRFSEL